MARMEKLNCSNCGATLEVDMEAQVLECKFCGTRLLLERERESPLQPGIISRKHVAEVRQWLEKLGIDKSVDPLEMVYDLDLHGKTIDIQDLKYLAFLPNLSLLNMEGSNLTDEGTPYLKPLTSLKYLYIGSTGISDLAFAGTMEKMEIIRAAGTTVVDGGLAGIENLTWLKTVDLMNTEITDAGMEHLARLGSLESLDIEGTLVTVEGLKLLANLRGLKELRYPKNIRDAELLRAGIMKLQRVKTVINLSDSGIEDSELEVLEAMKSVETLDLRSNTITDDGLLHLKGLGRLNYLDLSRNKITDAGIEHLAGLKRLATLDLSANRVTEKGVKKMKKLLPKAKIYA